MDTNTSVNKSNIPGPWALTTRRVVLGAIFGAMTLVLGGLGLGAIPVPNISGGATILQVPTIVGGIIGGPLVGLLCGAIFGVYELVTFPIFGPFVHIPSRLLIGIVAWLVYTLLRRVNISTVISAVVAALAGALTNTVVTLGMAVLLGMVPPEAVIPIIPQALIEMAIAAVITPIVVVAVNSIPNARGN